MEIPNRINIATDTTYFKELTIALVRRIEAELRKRTEGMTQEKARDYMRKQDISSVVYGLDKLRESVYTLDKIINNI